MSKRLENFKLLYRATRNYTLLTEDGGMSDEEIFGGLLTGSGKACVYSAWEVYNELRNTQNRRNVQHHVDMVIMHKDSKL